MSTSNHGSSTRRLSRRSHNEEQLHASATSAASGQHFIIILTNDPVFLAHTQTFQIQVNIRSSICEIKTVYI